MRAGRIRGDDCSPNLDVGERKAVSVVIGTSGRSCLFDAVASVLASEGVVLDLIVVNQAPADREDPLAELAGDRRLRVVRSDTRGVSAARNLGISMARNELVLIIDDDVTVGPRWAADFTGVVLRNDRIGVAFCDVTAVTHDRSAGFVPDHIVHRSQIIRSIVFKSRIEGIGAGMAVRRDVAVRLGGFDEMLGPGAPFRASEDRDIAMRALQRGWLVLATDEASVTHHGFRSWDEGRAHSERDWFGIGATYAKQVKALDVRVVPVLVHEVIIRGVVYPLSRLLRGHRPRGLKQILHFSRGFVAGLTTPIDRRTRTYRPRKRCSSPSSRRARS